MVGIISFLSDFRSFWSVASLAVNNSLTLGINCCFFFKYLYFYTNINDTCHAENVCIGRYCHTRHSLGTACQCQTCLCCRWAGIHRWTTAETRIGRRPMCRLCSCTLRRWLGVARRADGRQLHGAGASGDRVLASLLWYLYSPNTW